MKNSNKNKVDPNILRKVLTRNENGSFSFRNRLFFFITLSIIIIGLSSATKEKETKVNELSLEVFGEREVMNEIIATLDANDCLQILVSSVSVKKNNPNERAFTSYGTTELILENGSTVRSPLAGINTSFSDKDINRSFTKEHIYFVYKDNSFKIKIRLQSWGNETIELSDARIVKRQQGYFATGNYSNGRRVVYYTAAIYDDYRYQCISGLPRK